MAKNTSPSLEELIQIASQEPDKRVAYDTDENSRVERFILAHDVQEGDYKIKTSIIYNLYKDWETEKPLSNRAFFKQFSQFFPKKGRTKKYRYYYLDPTPFPEEDLEYLRERK